MPAPEEKDLRESSAALKELLKGREVFRAKTLLSDFQPADIAEILEEWGEAAEKAVLFRLLPHDLAAETFSHLSAEEQQNLLIYLADSRVSDLLENLEPDDRAALFEELPASVSRRLLRLLNPQSKKVLMEMLNYPEDSAGRLMTPHFVDLKESMTVRQAIDRIRELGVKSETIYTCYVTTNRKLIGVVSLKDLVLSNPDQLVTEIMESDVIFAQTTEDQEEVARTLERYDLLALPIVNRHDQLVGIVTIDDVVDILKEEATEDAHLMAAMEPVEASYFETDYTEFVKKRSVWLIILFIEGLFTVTILKHYDATLSQIVALVAFLPLIISSGGNVGSQSSALITRAIALEEVNWKDFFHVIRKEAFIGMTLGGLLGILGLTRAFIGGEASQVALIVSTTLFLVVFLSAVIGSGIPLILHRLGFDPAVSSSPFIASLIDVIGMIIFCNIALYSFHLHL